MTLASSGALSLNNIAGEFGGSTPHSLSEYYDSAVNVPTSGTISVSDFYGKAASFSRGLLHTLDNPDPYTGSQVDDYFGDAVAIDGNYAIVGAYHEDHPSGDRSGRAYIYNVTTGSLLRTINNPNVATNDYFGRAVGISGNYAIVGAPTNGSSGRAYIFNITNGNLVHTLNNPNAVGSTSGDEFGTAVGISGNYAIVSTPEEDGSSGYAYIFNVSTGSLVHSIANPNVVTSSGDHFGWSCGISGNYAVVSAPFEEEAGSAYFQSGKTYTFNVTTGALVSTFDNPNAFGTPAGDDVGTSVAISGNYGIAGTWEEDDSGGTRSGKAYIFNVTNGNLVHTLNNPNAFGTSASDYFGIDVGISGNYAIVGSYEEDAGGTFSGKAYIFNVSNGNLAYTLDNPTAFGTSASDQFSVAVAISNHHAIVGAPFEDDSGGSSSGKAYIY